MRATIVTAARAALATLRSSQPAVDRPRWRRVVWCGWMVVLLGAMILVLVLSRGNEVAGYSPPPPELLAFTVLAWLPLWLMPRRPHLALAGAAVGECLHIGLVPLLAPALEPAVALTAYQPVPIATMVAAWTLSSRVTGGWVWGVGAGLLLLLVGVVSRPPALLLTHFITFNVVLTVTALGTMLTVRRDRFARLVRSTEEQARTMVVDERLRIARDLHDVLAHHLALVNAQAGVAAYLVRTDPLAAAKALDDMANHTRKALDGLRATVGLLRRSDEPEAAAGAAPDADPLPGVERIEELLGALRATGTPVRLTVHGVPGTLDTTADVAAYRIVQEALTNATKHAPGAPLTVELTWTTQCLEIHVANGPPLVEPTVRAPGTGHGLLGMRERAKSCGGSFDAWRPLGGGFVVHAVIPARSPDRSFAPRERTTP